MYTEAWEEDLGVGSSDDDVLMEVSSVHAQDLTVKGINITDNC